MSWYKFLINYNGKYVTNPQRKVFLFEQKSHFRISSFWVENCYTFRKTGLQYWNWIGKKTVAITCTRWQRNNESPLLLMGQLDGWIAKTTATTTSKIEYKRRRKTFLCMRPKMVLMLAISPRIGRWRCFLFFPFITHTKKRNFN